MPNKLMLVAVALLAFWLVYHEVKGKKYISSFVGSLVNGEEVKPGGSD